MPVSREVLLGALIVVGVLLFLNLHHSGKVLKAVGSKCGLTSAVAVDGLVLDDKYVDKVVLDTSHISSKITIHVPKGKTFVISEPFIYNKYYTISSASNSLVSDGDSFSLLRDGSNLHFNLGVGSIIKINGKFYR